MIKFDFGKMGNFMEGAGPIKDDSIVLTFNGAIAVRREDGESDGMNSFMKNMMEMNMMQMFIGGQQQVQSQQGFGMNIFGNAFGTQPQTDTKDEIIKTQEEIIKQMNNNMRKLSERLNELESKSNVTITAKASIVDNDIEK